MIRVEVTNEVLPARTPKSPRNQVMWGYFLGTDGKPEPHPRKVFHGLWDRDEPVAPGWYILSPQSVTTDKYGAFALAPKFVPAPK